VILAAGSIGSAQLLLLSGIGPGRDLYDLGIPVVLDRPGVGQNSAGPSAAAHDLQGLRREDPERDLSLAHRPRRDGASTTRCAGAGRCTMAPSQLGLFTRSDPSRERANIQFHVQPLSLDKFGDPLHTYPAFHDQRVQSPAGRAAARCGCARADPADKPIIAPNYLSAEEDRRVAADSIRVARAIVAQPALQTFKPVETLPGEQFRSDDEAALAKAAGDIGTTIFIPVGTAKDGADQRPERRHRRAACACSASRACA
jgi:choline dehydrogenase-like flavoprotein